MNSENQESAVDRRRGRMPFLDHLEELRKRLIHGVAAILIGFGICLYFSERLLSHLGRADHEGSSRRFVAGLHQSDRSILRVFESRFLGGLLLTLPYVLYELWKFIYPGLHIHERKMAAPFVIIAAALFIFRHTFRLFLRLSSCLEVFYRLCNARSQAHVRDEGLHFSGDHADAGFRRGVRDAYCDRVF